MKRILLLLALFAPSVFAAPFLVADVSDARANQCLYTKAPAAAVTSAVVIGTPNTCRIDLAGTPPNVVQNITLAVRESSTGLTSAAVAFAFTNNGVAPWPPFPPAPLPAPSNIRLVP